MEYATLGKSGIRVSRIGFGCMSLKSNDPEAAALLHQALEAGITYFDTADVYEEGLNEQLVGKAFKDRRSEVVIATKAGNMPGTNTGKGWQWNASRQYILQAAEASLRNLQTDYIDLYQLHGGTINDPFEETIDAFETLKQQGKVRAYGISSIRPNVIHRYLEVSEFDSNMMQYSLLDRRPEELELDLLEKAEVSVLARGSLAQGLLINKPPKDYLGYTREEVSKLADKVAELSVSRSPAHTALRYVLQQPAVTAAVIGIRTQAQLEDITGVFQTPALTTSERDALRQLLAPNTYTEHRV